MCCVQCQVPLNVGKLRLIFSALSQHFIATVAEYAVVEVPHVNDVDAWQNICFGRQAQARVASCQQNNGAEVTHLTAEVCVKLMALTPVRHWLSLLCDIYTGRTVATLAAWFVALGALTGCLLLNLPAKYRPVPVVKL